jgi:hypothetical protein
MAGGAQELEDHRHDGRLAARPSDGDRPPGGGEGGEKLRAVENGNRVRARRAHVGDRLLDRGRHDHCVQVRADAAPVLGDDAHARALERAPDRRCAAAIEGAVAPRRTPAAQRLELREGAHPAAGDSRIEKMTALGRR